MLSAKEVKQLMPSKMLDVDVALEHFEKIFKVEAEKNRSNIRLSRALVGLPEPMAKAFANAIHHEAGNKMVYTDTERSFVNSVFSVLREHGYAVTVLYEERQFVDCDYIISWA